MDNPPQIVIAPMLQQLEVQAPNDDWTGISNTAARRKLQNRLNQRARRRRQREIKTGKEISPIDDIQDISHDISSIPHDTSHDIHHDIFDISHISHISHIISKRICRLGNKERRKAIIQLASQAYASYNSGHMQLNHLPIIMGFNVFRALFHNNIALGFHDEWLQNDSTSPFCLSGPGLGPLHARSHCPATLRPSTTQITIPHHPWIDLFPMERMRDNFIKAVSGPNPIDEDDLCFDICDVDEGDRTNKASLIVWGEPSDPRSWEATVPFLKKWGFLLQGCVEMMESTNRWRVKRGERALKFE